MPRALPPQPHIDWLKKAAKDRLAELRAGDPAAKLHQAQLALAREYGFASWRALKAHVDAQSLDGRIIATVLSGDAATLSGLLAASPHKLHITGGQWNRPLLHLAAENGHLDSMNLLLRLGFAVNTRDRFDKPAALRRAPSDGT